VDVFTAKLLKSTKSIQSIVVPGVFVGLHKRVGNTLQTSEICTDVLTSFYLIRPCLLLSRKDNLRESIFMP